MTSSFDSEALVVKQPFDLQNSVDILLGIDPVPGTIFCWRKIGKFRFPIAQDIRLQDSNIANLANGIIQFFYVRRQWDTSMT